MTGRHGITVYVDGSDVIQELGHEQIAGFVSEMDEAAADWSVTLAIYRAFRQKLIDGKDELIADGDFPPELEDA